MADKYSLKLQRGKHLVGKKENKQVTFDSHIRVGERESLGKNSVTNSYENKRGISSVVQQIYRKICRHKYEFTVMLVGETGIGKTTLLNTMFLSDGLSIKSVEKTQEVQEHKLQICEDLGNGSMINIDLTVIDTPGLGDATLGQSTVDRIVEYVEQQHVHYLEREHVVERCLDTRDNRVHVCIYFLPHTGHGLKSRDVELMQRLGPLVTLVPVIGRADMCTKEEIKIAKEMMETQLSNSGVPLMYPVLDNCSECQHHKLPKMPFAAVGSNAVIEGVDGRLVRGRIYPWGTVNIENRDHCDYLPLRHILFSAHIDQIKTRTDVLYQRYRTNVLEHYQDEGQVNIHPYMALERENIFHMENISEKQKTKEKKLINSVEERKKQILQKNNDFELFVMKGKMHIIEMRQELEKVREAYQEEMELWDSFMTEKEMGKREKNKSGIFFMPNKFRKSTKTSSDL